jgi:RimJ/RimL family protein N-acetyltransferase
MEVTAPLETDRLRLRLFRLEDVDDVLAYRSLPEVVRYLYEGSSTRAEIEDTIVARAAMTRLRLDGDGIALAMERRSDGHVIGEITLRVRSAEHRQGEIGFLLHPDAQGQGYATEAATAMLDLAFGPVGLHRVYGRADARNEASAALMRRLGMRQEAHLRESEMFKGAWGDEVTFAVLENEWRRRARPRGRRGRSPGPPRRR